MIKKVEKKFKKVNSQKGFTLLEILVVLTIMGFLIAMVAPRLAGISGDAVDIVCDSNQNRMVTYVSSYFEKTNRFPSKLTNLVCEDASGSPAYHKPTVSDQNPDLGAETLAKELDDRNHFKIHFLSAAEALELKNMGIVEVFNLNSYDNLTVTKEAAFMTPVTPAADVGVLMVGIGYDLPTTTWVEETEEAGWGEPNLLGRIVLGMGSECELITSGVISNAAHCPGGIQNADNVTYNDYNIVLPRLEATVEVTGYPLTSVDALAYDGTLPVTTEGVVGAVGTNPDNLKKRNFVVNEGQERWQFATMCPEGHMYPADDEEFWAIDMDSDAQIN